MTRFSRLAAAAVLVTAVAVSATQVGAQTHSQTQAHQHAQMLAHLHQLHTMADSAHLSAMLDSAHMMQLHEHHAIMHEMMTGVWEGTFDSPHSSDSHLRMTVSHDSTLALHLELGRDQPLTAGAATNFRHDGAALHWEQQISGTTCKASLAPGEVDPAEASTLHPLHGRIVCENGELVFTVRKKTG